MIDGKIKAWLPAICANSGADVFTRRLANALERHGVAVEISWFPLRYELLPFPLKSIPPPDSTDIVIANSWNAFAFKRDGLPLIVVEHHCVFDPAFRSCQSTPQNLYHHLLVKPYEMRSFRSADAVVAVSNFTAGSLRQSAGITDVEVIHNWIDTDIFCPAIIERAIGEPFRLLFVGNPSYRKGGDLLAAIMRKLGPGYELRFTAGLRGKNAGLDQSNMVPLGKLTGEQLIQAYQECDALLFPTRYEGFGYVALEAMACGKPVITTNNTALPEVVVDGITGVLCDTDDTDAFADACRLLASDPELRSLMGRAGRQRAIERFSESASVRLYLDMIEAVLMKNGVDVPRV